MNEPQPHQWMPVPGAENVCCMPVLRPADLSCSNAFLLRFPRHIVLLDPGADDEQARMLADAIRREREHGDLCVWVILTHCHRDHARCLPLMRSLIPPPCFFMAHPDAVNALAAGSSELTASFVYGEQTVPFAMDGSLPFGENAPAEGTFTPPGAEPVRWTRTAATAHDPECLRLHLDAGHTMTLYPTPGHTPDSICLQAGAWLFTGDLLFAHNPGIAGIPGWSRDDLTRSLKYVLDSVIPAGHIESVWTGHGPLLPVQQAAEQMKKNLVLAGNLPLLARLDAERIAFLRECVSVFLREVGEQLAALGGRLHLLADRLAELEEQDRAQSVAQAIQLDSLDEFLDEFHQFTRNDTEGNALMAVPVKGLITLRRISRVLQSSRLPGQLCLLQLQRLELLLKDYFNLLSGINLMDHGVPVELGAVVRNLRDVLAPASLDQERAAVLADDPAAFSDYLALRLEGLARRGQVLLEFEGEQSVTVEPEHLHVLLGDLLENLLCATPPRELRIRLVSDPSSPLPRLEIHPSPPLAVSESKQRFYTLYARLMECRIAFDPHKISLIFPHTPKKP